MQGEIAVISGQLSGQVSVSGTLSGELALSGQLSGKLDPGGGSIPPYEGDYEVTPKVNEDQTLPTKNHRMKEDLTVTKIPVYEVSGPTGGTTIIIGEM